jgi:carboxyl-terminal processing protease
MKRWVSLMAVAAGSAVAALALGAGTPQRDGARLLDQVMTRLQREAIDSLSQDEIYERAARGLVRQIDDPYAALFSPDEMARFSREGLGNSYGGVGLLIEDQDGLIVVTRVFADTPGELGGVVAGDRILEVDGQSVKGFKLDQVSRRLLGTPGTSVALTLLRDGSTVPVTYHLTRATVHVPSVPLSLVLNNGIGYVSLQRFNDVASEELGRAVTQLMAEGARGLVLDLRGNPGGDLEQSIRVANLFLPPGEDVVTVRYRSRPADSRRTAVLPVAPNLPLVVLTDSNTASASEIVAGALQDHDRAVLLGTTSYGKGVVQTLYPLEGGWMLKLTNAKWYTPSGRSIQKERGPRDDSLPPADTTRPAFRSDKGRTVLGGGGIVPDVLVGSDTLSTVEQSLQRALSAKARESNAALTQMTRELKPKVKYNFTVQPSWRDTLYARLTRAGVEINRPQYDASRALVDRLLEQRVSRAAFGDTAAFRRWAPEDAQLHRALELLGAAHSQQELLAVVVREDG